MKYTGPSAKPHDSGVAVGIVVIQHGKLLLMKRTGGSTGEGTWAIPGGAVDFMEDPEDAAARELAEETGLKAQSFQMLGYTNDQHIKEKLHYIGFTMATDSFTGEPKIMEPHKATEIGWFDISELPSPLYRPTEIKLADPNVLRFIKEKS